MGNKIQFTDQLHVQAVGGEHVIDLLCYSLCLLLSVLILVTWISIFVVLVKTMDVLSNLSLCIVLWYALEQKTSGLHQLSVELSENNNAFLNAEVFPGIEKTYWRKKANRQKMAFFCISLNSLYMN